MGLRRRSRTARAKRPTPRAMAGGAVAPKAMRAACFPEFSRQKTEPGQKPTSAATSTRSSRAAISPGRTWRGPRVTTATPPHWRPRAVHLSTLNVEHDASCDPRNGCRWLRMRGVETIGEPFSKRTLLLTRPRATSNPGPGHREPPARSHSPRRRAAGNVPESPRRHKR